MTMKNPLIKISIFTVFFLILGLSGCSFWQGDLAKIVISFGGTGRAAYDAGNTQDHERLNHKVILTSAAETLNFDKSGTTFEAYVMPGNWNILIYSYLDGEIYAMGSKDVILVLGQDNVEIIDMYQAHLVKFDSQGGSAVPDQIIQDGKQAQRPSAPSKRGCVFAGWYYNEEEFDFNSPITESITLYAEWNIILEVPGNSLAEKLGWLKENAVDGAEYYIPVNKNENLAPQDLSYDGKKISITLKGDTQARTVSLSDNGSLFTVGTGVTLILDSNIILKGRTDNNKSLITINSGGFLETNAQSKITGNGNYNCWQAGVYINENATFTMNDGEISGNKAGGCGGVWVEGTFIMSGGEISDNIVNGNSGGGVWVAGGTFTMSGTAKISRNIVEGDSGGEGGGVHMYKENSEGVKLPSGTFTMNGGEISGNEAWGSGGVSIHYGIFNMSGTAKISRNTATKWGSGGVKVYGDSTFNMTGGEISNNTVNSGCGGGVLVEGTLNMSGTAKISGNNVIGIGDDTWNAGGGVCVYSGKFTMEGGEISDNHVYGCELSEAGGIFVGGGDFTMISGTICYNTATNGGGGVKVANRTGKFTMKGGTISNNKGKYGGGVDAGGGTTDDFGGTFIMDDGEISGNKATNATDSSGGGVNVGGNGTSAATFTMNGGKIFGNKAEGNGDYQDGFYTGGGVKVYKAKFTMKGGEIYGNTAKQYGGGVCVDEGTFEKLNTGGTIYGFSDDSKSNQAYDGRGHAVYATGFVAGEYITKYKNSNVESNMELTYSNSVFSGDWDKEPNTFIDIEIVNMDEWELLNQKTITVSKDEEKLFEIQDSYKSSGYQCEWYLDGNPVVSTTGFSYSFTPTKTGVYEVAVIVTDTSTGEKRSGSCQVIVR